MATAMQDTSTDIRCKVDTAQLRAMIQATATFAAKRDDPRKSLTCVQVSIDGDTLRMVATDGYRLSETTTEVLMLSEDRGHVWLIDAAELAAAGKALDKHAPCTIIAVDESGLIVGDDYLLHQQGLTYPNWRVIMPAHTAHTCLVPVEAIEAACKTAIAAGADLVTFSIHGADITVGIPEKDGEHSGMTYNVHGTTSELTEIETAFNPAYLRDAARLFKVGRYVPFSIDANKKYAPVLMRSGGLSHVLMPMAVPATKGR